MGIFGFVTSWSEMQVAWELPNLWQVSEVRAVLLETVRLICGV